MWSLLAIATRRRRARKICSQLLLMKCSNSSSSLVKLGLMSSVRRLRSIMSPNIYSNFRHTIFRIFFLNISFTTNLIRQISSLLPCSFRLGSFCQHQFDSKNCHRALDWTKPGSHKSGRCIFGQFLWCLMDATHDNLCAFVYVQSSWFPSIRIFIFFFSSSFLH